MIAHVDDEIIQIPQIVQGWYVNAVLPLEYLNTAEARSHRRLAVFAKKGVKCVVPDCPCEGAFLLERIQKNKSGEIMGYHIDLFTKNLELMTVDHHISRSKGGKDHISNKFPMCQKHNNEKSNLDPEIFYEIFGRSKK